MNNKLLQRVKDLVLDNQYAVSKKDEAVLELYQRYVALERVDQDFDISSVKQTFLNFALQYPSNDRLEMINAQGPFIWGMKPKETTTTKILKGILDNNPVYFAEDAFLSCIVGIAHRLPQDKKYYQNSCGYLFDDLTAYFDGTRSSRMELILNSDFEVSQEQKERSAKIIKRLMETKISKYNNQPIYQPQFGRPNVPKILVIDQSYRDFSISKGCADDSTFPKMLDCAIKENPDADILIKTHPDAIGEDSTKQRCYYQYVQEKDNVHKITDGINPISMIEYCDKVYVCSSQFGFESLMCGKETHVFGMPFYAGWGLTIDDQKCPRRTRSRTLEEIFYIAYIYLAQYVNPQTDKPCEIEEVIDYLLETRTKYFKEDNIRSEL